MMHIYKILILSTLLLPSMALAQKEGERIKFGKLPNKTYKKINAVFLPPVYKDETKVKSAPEPNDAIEYVGNSFKTDFDFFKKASIASATDDETTYILYFTSPNAYGLIIRFSEFILPNGAELFFENETRDTTYDHWAGPFSSSIGEIFDTRILQSGNVFMRLKIKNSSVKDCKLNIIGIDQDFKAWWKHSCLKSARDEIILVKIITMRYCIDKIGDIKYRPKKLIGELLWF